MRHLLAGLLVGAFAFSPVATVVTTGALAVDCTDPANARPGGYCSLSTGTGSLSSPNTSDVGCIPKDSAVLSEDFFTRVGQRILVAAAPSWEPCPTGEPT